MLHYSLHMRYLFISIEKLTSLPSSTDHVTGLVYKYKFRSTIVCMWFLSVFASISFCNHFFMVTPEVNNYGLVCKGTKQFLLDQNQHTTMFYCSVMIGMWSSVGKCISFGAEAIYHHVITIALNGIGMQPVISMPRVDISQAYSVGLIIWLNKVWLQSYYLYSLVQYLICKKKHFLGFQRKGINLPWRFLL